MAENIMSFRETGTTNAVKILPTIQNINNYIGITTELDSHVQVGDIVYITYRYDEYSSNTLDNYLDYFHDDGYPFIDYVNGYKVKEVQVENNLIIIDKTYGNLARDYQILEHYLSIKSFNLNQTANYISIAKIHSTLFKNVYINSTSSSNIDLQQAYILSGTIKNTNFKNKYYFKYLSLNTTSSGSTYSYNNNKYGYTYCYGTSTNYINLESCVIDNGRFFYANISATTINDGYFENCNFSATTINGGYLYNCILDSTCIWNNGDWDYQKTPSASAFGPTNWPAGIWHNGDFAVGKFWSGGTFYNGTFSGTWYNGTFNGTKVISGANVTYNSIFLGTWYNGVFNGGLFGNEFASYETYPFNWYNGIVNDGDFYNVKWYKGTFNNGNFIIGRWIDGTFNNGYYYGDTYTNIGVWENGIFNNGIIESAKWRSGSFYNGTMKYCIFYNGTFYNGDFISGIFVNGIFKHGNILEKSTWENGLCEYANMSDSEWHNGSWKDGTVTNCNFLNVNWSGGTFNSGQILYTSASTGAWYNGNFNNGIFGYSAASGTSTTAATFKWLEYNKSGVKYTSVYKSTKTYNNSTIANIEMQKIIYGNLYGICYYSYDLKSSNHIDMNNNTSFWVGPADPTIDSPLCSIYFKLPVLLGNPGSFFQASSTFTVYPAPGATSGGVNYTGYKTYYYQHIYHTPNIWVDVYQYANAFPNPRLGYLKTGGSFAIVSYPTDILQTNLTVFYSYPNESQTGNWYNGNLYGGTFNGNWYGGIYYFSHWFGKNMTTTPPTYIPPPIGHSIPPSKTNLNYTPWDEPIVKKDTIQNGNNS